MNKIFEFNKMNKEVDGRLVRSRIEDLDEVEQDDKNMKKMYNDEEESQKRHSKRADAVHFNGTEREDI